MLFQYVQNVCCGSRAAIEATRTDVWSTADSRCDNGSGDVRPGPEAVIGVYVFKRPKRGINVLAASGEPGQ